MVVTNDLLRWRANCCPTSADGKNVEVYGKWFVGDKIGAFVGELDADSLLEFTEPMRCEIVTGIIHDDQNWVSISTIMLDMESGVGTGTVTDPQITMEKSHDAGTTWSTALSRDLGASGAKSTRMRWNRLGAGRQTILRFRIDDAVKRVFLAMHGDFLQRSN